MRLQWTFASNQDHWFRWYRWTHPTRGMKCRYVGLVLFTRELRWWTIDPIPEPHPDDRIGPAQWPEPRDWNAQFELKWQDAWIGAFWKRTGACIDLWVCLIPCVPLHLSWWSNKDPEEANLARRGEAGGG